MMYTIAFALALLASASAFAPAQESMRVSTARNALFDNISNLDLWAPVSKSNEYGARKGKNLKVGNISEKSYVPSGLSKAQYEKIRKAESDKKAARYEANVSKAFKFIDFTDWYAKRGTDLDQSWIKSVTLGHRMAKTKYDWSGTADAKQPESTRVNNFLNKKTISKKK